MNEKEFTDKQNTLYIAIALESIKKDEVVAQGNTNNGVTQYPRSSNISISDLLRNVNPLDESFYKYIPKMFFEGKNTPKKRYALPVVDSDGKALSATQQDYFKDSKVRDENGKLLPVYHSTDYDFNEFTADESWDSFGFHFGTLKAAKDRGGRNIKKCYLNLTNVLEVDEDLGYWDAYGFTWYLRKHPELLNDIKIDGWEEMMEVWESEDFDNDPDTAYWDAEYGETIRKALYNSKYDGGNT